MCIENRCREFATRNVKEGSVETAFVLCVEHGESYEPFAVAWSLPVECFQPFACIAVSMETGECFRRLGVGERGRWT